MRGSIQQLPVPDESAITCPTAIGDWGGHARIRAPKVPGRGTGEVSPEILSKPLVTEGPSAPPLDAGVCAMSFIRIVKDQRKLASLEHLLKAYPRHPYSRRDLVMGWAGERRADLYQGLPAWKNECGTL